MRIKGTFLILFFAVAGVFSSYAADKVSKVTIKGNKIVSNAAIMSTIKTRKGQLYNEDVINSDVKDLYATGYFENIEVSKKKTAEGVEVIFKFKEKPVVNEVTVKGTRRINKKRIEKLITIKKGSFLDEYQLKEVANTIEDFYQKRGFSEAKVTYKTSISKDNHANVKFIISENSRIRVRKIIIKGNKNVRTKRILKLMHTKKKWFFIRSGILKESTLVDDVKRIEDFYKERGFSEVKASYSISRSGRNAYVTITINEGKRYYIGAVMISGNKVITTKQIRKSLGLKENDVYIESKVNEAVDNIRGLYIDRGYIYAAVKPVTFFNPQTKKIDITFKIKERHIAHVEKIEIRGNTKTRDEVIRRELRIYPGDKFEGGKIRKSRQRLENLGFFENIRFSSEPGSKPNWENLIINVKEAKTGYLSFGGGYSSVDSFTGFVELRQRNFDYKNWRTFTGGGQDLTLMASAGSVTKRYELDFTNPWIFDKPISFGFQLYKRGHQQDENVGYGYEEDVTGEAIKFGREFNDQFKGSIGYRFESVKIKDVVSDASQALKDEVGTKDLSTIELGTTYDTRDNVFSPSKGIYFNNSLGITASFLGGDTNFVRFESEFSKFFPLMRRSVIEFKLRVGIENTFSDTDKVPLYDRFFAGGASTIRGYHERKVGPIDPITHDPIGGDSLFVGNIEYTYPLNSVLKAAAFFDTGNVWKKAGDLLSGGIKSSVGVGIRVKTPMGPLSIDYGWPLNVEPGETSKTGRFNFNVSRGF